MITIKEVTKVEVGKELPFKNLSMPTDGAVLELSNESKGFLFVIGFTNMKDNEVQGLKKGDIEFRYVENENFMLPLIKIGDYIFEWVFNPFLYPNGKERLVKIQESNLVNLIAYDRNDRIVKVLRSLSINDKLREKWINKMTDMNSLNQREIRFNSFISSIQGYGTVEKLWEEAEKI